jgi:MerR family transcriptional regulator, heat shock protein HspR
VDSTRGPTGGTDERLREEETALMSRSSEDARTFLISVAAELAGMHAQTLRTYDRLGLVSPQRSSGGGRRYSQHDVDLLREVQRLSQDEGVNLAGIKRIIELTNQVEALQSRLREMAAEIEVLRANQRRDIAVVPKSTAVVVWKPRQPRR